MHHFTCYFCPKPKPEKISKFFLFFFVKKLPNIDLMNCNFVSYCCNNGITATVYEFFQGRFRDSSSSELFLNLQRPQNGFLCRRTFLFSLEYDLIQTAESMQNNWGHSSRSTDEHRRKQLRRSMFLDLSFLFCILLTNLFRSFIRT